MGLSRYDISLYATSRPDPPSYLKVHNVTYNSVNLTWTPGFDGGFSQTFKIRYQKEGAENYQYVDVAPPGASSFEVQDLKVDTKYSISLMAFNKIGASAYTPQVLVGTKSKSIFFKCLKRPKLSKRSKRIQNGSIDGVKTVPKHQKTSKIGL